MGGRGKTPAAILVARLLLEAGERPAVLSRGYGRRYVEDGVVIVSDGERLHADLDRSGDETHGGGGAYFGLYKDLLPSIVGVGVSAEGSVGGYSGVEGVNGGLRGLLELRSLFLKAGVHYDAQHDDASFILSFTVPLRRGGLLGHGTTLRVDWLPGRGHSWNFGVQVPLEPHMGNTRPRDTEVDLPGAFEETIQDFQPDATLREWFRDFTIVNATKQFDVTALPEAGKYFAEHLPNARLEIFKDTGHWLQIEQGPKFAQLVRSFLKEA